MRLMPFHTFMHRWIAPALLGLALAVLPVPIAGTNMMGVEPAAAMAKKTGKVKRRKARREVRQERKAKRQDVRQERKAKRLDKKERRRDAKAQCHKLRTAAVGEGKSARKSAKTKCKALKAAARQ